jgi:hypothetical protein
MTTLQEQLVTAQAKLATAQTKYEDKIGTVSTEILNQFKDAVHEAQAAVKEIEVKIALAAAQQKRDALLAAQPRDVQAIAIAEKDVEAAQHHFDLLGKFS